MASAAIVIAVIASITYLVAIFPTNINQSTRKKFGMLGLILGFLHAGLMIFAKNLSLYEFVTYQKCLPFISLFIGLTSISYFYSQLSSLFYKVVRNLGFVS
ncbi:MAG: hypothetical protein AAGF07_04325 [Patescibacteria group bacterium]